MNNDQNINVVGPTRLYKYKPGSSMGPSINEDFDSFINLTGCRYIELDDNNRLKQACGILKVRKGISKKIEPSDHPFLDRQPCGPSIWNVLGIEELRL